jgi:hypothetical protein
MGGGPTAPALKEKEKKVVLAVLPWPEKVCTKSIRELEEEFEDVEVRFFYSHFENGKMTGVDVPEGMYWNLLRHSIRIQSASKPTYMYIPIRPNPPQSSSVAPPT